MNYPHKQLLLKRHSLCIYFIFYKDVNNKCKVACAEDHDTRRKIILKKKKNK